MRKSFGSRRSFAALASLAGLALASAAFGQVTYTSTPNLAIPDSPTVSDTITVSGGTASMTGLTVRINATHTFDADVDIALVHNGNYILLTSDNGGAGDNFTNTVFDDAAVTLISAGVAPAVAPFTGSFRPEGLLNNWAGVPNPPGAGTNFATLSGFNGQDANGGWTLIIDDDLGGDVGVLLDWSITVSGSIGGPSNPFGTFAATPNSVSNCGGQTSVLTVTVTPGMMPASTGITVMGSLASVGGSATQAFLDDGVAPDAVAGDSIFTALATVSNATVAGSAAIPFTVSDAEARMSNGSGGITVIQCPPLNDECANAIVAGCGSTPFNTASSTVSAGFTYCAGSGGDVFFSFTAPQSGPTVVDTCGMTGDSVVAVYASCAGGASIACNDDANPPAPAPCDTTLASYLEFTAIQGTTYIIAIRGFSATAASGNLNITCATGISGTGSASPTKVFNGLALPGSGSTTTLSCQVFPAPTSTGVAVTAAFDGGAPVAMTAGAGDLFTLPLTVTGATTPGVKTVVYQISDAQGRMFTVSTTITVCAAVIDLGKINSESDGTLVMASTLTAGGIQWYKFSTSCDTLAASGLWFDINTNNSVFDTEIGLYDMSGNLVGGPEVGDGADDDDGLLAASALSYGSGSTLVQGGTGTLDGTPVVSDGRDGATVPTGMYYLALGQFNVNFAATGFGVTGTGGAGGLYDITFDTNICPAVCDGIDFNADGVSPDSLDLEDFLSVFGGGPCSNDPNCGDIDFNNDGVSPDSLDIDLFIAVFGGGGCP